MTNRTTLPDRDGRGIEIEWSPERASTDKVPGFRRWTPNRGMICFDWQTLYSSQRPYADQRYDERPRRKNFHRMHLTIQYIVSRHFPPDIVANDPVSNHHNSWAVASVPATRRDHRI